MTRSDKPTPERDELWSALTARKESGIPDAVLLGIAGERFAALERDRNRLLAELAGIVEQCAKVCDEKADNARAIWDDYVARCKADPENIGAGSTAWHHFYEECAAAIRSLPAQAEVKEEDVSLKYWELIYAVGNKYLGETRHETALRYIQQAENQTHGPDAARAQGRGDEH